MSRVLAVAVMAIICQPTPRFGQSPPPVDVGFQEEVGITLMILDIDARDGEGRPIPGLTKEDFLLSLGLRAWDIYAVDDLCPCSLSPGDMMPDREILPAASSAAMEALPGDSTATSRPTAVRSSVVSPAGSLAVSPLLQQRFILYFDFSQMRPDGRDRAFIASRRWLTETKRPQDWVQMMAFVSRGGLREMSGFTQDRDVLLDILNSAENDLEYFDDYPARYSLRIDACEKQGGLICKSNAMQEYRHGQRSLRNLRQFLASLEALPGRKEMMYFHQNNVLFPAELYHGDAKANFEIGDNRKILEEVGAAATGSGTRVHALSTHANRFFSGSADMAANLGANLADYTGGTYSQASSDLAILMDRPINECACRYRLSFEPPSTARNKMHKVRVEIRNQRLPYSYRIEYVTKEQRLIRQAMAMLDFPDSRRDFPVNVSLVPTKRTKHGWDVTASVLVKMDSLSFANTPDGLQVELDVGAILYPQYEHGGGKVRQMFGGTRVRIRDPVSLDQWLVHRHLFSGIAGGEYRLAGYIHNVDMNLYGGGEEVVILPKVSLTALVGPFIYQPDCSYFQSNLPTVKKRESFDPHPAAPSRGILPVAAEISQGQEILFVTWSCTPHKDPIDLSGEPLVRQIVKEGETLDTLTAPHFSAVEENCLKLVDSLDTARLQPGAYSYLVIRESEDGKAELRGEKSFQVVAEQLPQDDPTGHGPSRPDDPVAAQR